MTITHSTTEHQKLLRMFVGNWLGRETIYPSAMNPVLDQGTTEAKRTALGEFFVLSDHLQRRDSGVIFQNHLVLGWDTQQQKVLMHQFDSTGRFLETPAMGNWDENTLILERESAIGRFRYRYAFSSENQYEFCFEICPDSQDWLTSVDGTFNRISPS